MKLWCAWAGMALLLTACDSSGRADAAQAPQPTVLSATGPIASSHAASGSPTPVATTSASSSAPAASATGAPPPVKRRYSVAAMGDSLSDPKAHGGKYLTYLAEQCPLSRFETWGKGGNMVSQMRKRFARDVLGEGQSEPRSYTHLIVLGGIADIGSNETANRTLPKIQADLSEMYRLAQEAGLEVIALTIPPWGGYHTYNDERHRMMLAMNAWLRAKPKDVEQVVDVYPLLVCGQRELCEKYAADTIHWNAKAHNLVGGVLRKQVFSDCE